MSQTDGQNKKKKLFCAKISARFVYVLSHAAFDFFLQFLSSFHSVHRIFSFDCGQVALGQLSIN